MRSSLRAFIATVGVTAGLAGCGATIEKVNLRPTEWYEQKVSITGRITRMQDLQDGVVLELADARDHLLLAHVRKPIDVGVGDWVKVTGVLVPEADVEGRRLYDVVEGESVSTTRAPLFDKLF